MRKKLALKSFNSFRSRSSMYTRTGSGESRRIRTSLEVILELYCKCAPSQSGNAQRRLVACTGKTPITKCPSQSGNAQRRLVACTGKTPITKCVVICWAAPSNPSTYREMLRFFFWHRLFLPLLLVVVLVVFKSLVVRCCCFFVWFVVAVLRCCWWWWWLLVVVVGCCLLFVVGCCCLFEPRLHIAFVVVIIEYITLHPKLYKSEFRT